MIHVRARQLERFACVVALAFAASGSMGCHRDDAAGGADAGVLNGQLSLPPIVTPPSARDAGLEVASSCTFSSDPSAIAGGALAVGDGVRDAAGTGAIFGILRPTGAAAWAHVDPSGGAVALHDLPPSDPDAPPPRIVARGDDRFILYSRSGGAPGQAEHGRARLDASAASLRLVLAKLNPDGSAETTAEIASQRDDSLDNDAAFAANAASGANGSSGGLVVWDEDEPLMRFGVIRAARVDTNGHLVGVPFTVSADGTDAEAPRVFAVPGTSGGFVIVYRVRRGEDRDAGLVDNSAEAPGERRAYRWLEAVYVDGGSGSDAGAASRNDPAATRRLTSQTGHVGTFDLSAATVSDGGGTRGIDVLVHDDDAPTDAAGTRISRVRITTAHAAPGNPGDVSAAVPIVPFGAGAGAVSRLESVAACGAPGCDVIVYAAEDDSARMVRVDDAAAIAPPSSRETAFDGTDPVVRLPNGAVLVFLRDKGGSLRTVSCH